VISSFYRVVVMGHFATVYSILKLSIGDITLCQSNLQRKYQERRKKKSSTQLLVLRQEMSEDPTLNWVFAVSGLSHKTVCQKLWSVILFIGFVLGVMGFSFLAVMNVYYNEFSWTVVNLGIICKFVATYSAYREVVSQTSGFLSTEIIADDDINVWKKCYFQYRSCFAISVVIPFGSVIWAQFVWQNIFVNALFFSSLNLSVSTCVILWFNLCHIHRTQLYVTHLLDLLRQNALTIDHYHQHQKKISEIASLFSSSVRYLVPVALFNILSGLVFIHILRDTDSSTPLPIVLIMAFYLLGSEVIFLLLFLNGIAVTNDTVKHFTVAVVDKVDIRELAEGTRNELLNLLIWKPLDLKVYGLILTTSRLRTRVIGYLIALFLSIVRYLAGKYFNNN
jgi:hypothetical protein